MSIPKFTEKKYYLILSFVISLFFFWAVALTMGDVLNKHFQNVLNISKSKSGYIQLSIFGAYALMGVPAGIFMKKYGYKLGVILGLALFSLGSFLFIPAANNASFNFFRFALFVMALGMATLETVAHPFVAALGDERTSDQRVNFAQSFNGLGAIVGPLLGGILIFGSVKNANDNSLDSVKYLYTYIGILILVLAVIFSFIKVPDLIDPHANEDSNEDITSGDETAEYNSKAPLWKQRHFIAAVVAQFFNIAAQGGTWAYFINYGVEKMHLAETEASYYFSLSMAMMMLGRFLGTFLMRFIAPNKLLAIFTFCNIILCLIVAQSWGWASFISLIGLNLFLSIMYPTIFSLGLKKLGTNTQNASSFLVMAMFGGAVFPPLMGYIAEKNVAHAYLLPILCYAVIIVFAIKFYKPKTFK
ncbi:L-fucose:H+ symporter permease [Apibacter raozihei]|uniref:L-fucose:H+ symporter permease n=1 Tax=Apibacter raozihei TaxID=2500547 RepID=UPI000FE43A9E|nr:L-fucose:H+ symporter permease [Apibacter raozihei]